VGLNSKRGGDVEVNDPIVASEAGFKICPLCEESRLVFSGLNEARCPACDHEPSSDFLKALRKIVSLPETSEIPPAHSNENPEPENRTRGRG
jgi:hypothetical protein